MTGDGSGEVKLSAERYDDLLEELEDLRDRISVYERSGVTIPAAKLMAELGLAPDTVATPSEGGVESGPTYSYRAEWSAEDGEWVGLVAQFPSLSWLAATPGEAVAGVAALVDGILADMAQTGVVPPGSRP